MTKNYTGKLTSFTTYAMHVKKECINQRDLIDPLDYKFKYSKWS